LLQLIKKQPILFFVFSTIFIISNTYLEFFLNNIEQFDIVLISDLVSFYLKVIFLYFILFFIIYFFLKKNFFKATLSLAIFIYLSFYHFQIKNFIFNLLHTRFDGELALFLIIFASIIIFLPFFNNLFTKLILLFFVILFFSNFLLISVNLLNLKNTQSHMEQDSKIDFFNKEEIKIINQNHVKPNIYYVIVDSMISLSDFKNNFELNKEEIIENLYQKKLTYIENAKSNYPTSYLTLSSIFNLDNIVNENSEIYYDRANFYPKVLADEKNLPRLIATLNEIGYRFKLIGAHWGNCRYNEIYCISYNHENNTHNKKLYFIDNPNNYEVSRTLIKMTAIAGIITNIKKKILKNEKTFQHEFVNNDSIGRFIKLRSLYNENNIPHFYFIHHLAPHWPFVFDENCNERMDDSHIDNNLLGYQKSYKCVLEKIYTLMDYINLIDEDSIVVIQSNHGRSVSTKEDIIQSGYGDIDERFSIFSAIKLNDKCQLDVNKLNDNVNAIRNIISCPFGINKFIKSKRYIGFYETQDNYGKVFSYLNNP